ncbi:hypothetical protein [Rhodococcus globerulus]
MVLADDLRARADEAESLVRLPDDMAKGLENSGIIRMLARKEYDGF